MENYTGERCEACGAEVYEDERGEEQKCSKFLYARDRVCGKTKRRAHQLGSSNCSRKKVGAGRRL